MICTTLNKLKKSNCFKVEAGLKSLLDSLGKTEADDDSLGLDVILKINGLHYALLSTCTLPEYDIEWRLLACSYASRVAHLCSVKYSLAEMEWIERSLRFGEVTDELYKEEEKDLWVANRVISMFRVEKVHSSAKPMTSISRAMRDTVGRKMKYAANEAIEAATMARLWAAAEAAVMAVALASVCEKPMVNAFTAGGKARESEEEWQKSEFLKVIGYK